MEKASKKIAFIIAPENFRDEEYFQPKVILQAKGIHIDTAAKNNPDEVTGSQGGKARPDIKLSSVTPQNYDGVVFVGGSGAQVYFEDEEIHQIARDFDKAEKIIAAICIAPSILANAGLLKGHKATAFKSQLGNLKKKGVNVVDEDVVTDGRYITANGPEVALAFGTQISKSL